MAKQQYKISMTVTLNMDREMGDGFPQAEPKDWDWDSLLDLDVDESIDSLEIDSI